MHVKPSVIAEILYMYGSYKHTYSCGISGGAEEQDKRNLHPP